MSMTLCECAVPDEAISSSASGESAHLVSQDGESQTACERIKLQTEAESITTDRKIDAPIERYLYRSPDIDDNDSNSDPLYVRTRCYSPQLGRWLSRE